MRGIDSSTWSVLGVSFFALVCANVWFSPDVIFRTLLFYLYTWKLILTAALIGANFDTGLWEEEAPPTSATAAFKTPFQHHPQCVVWCGLCACRQRTS